ncbi:MAG: GNAT family N-acetyltransferase, partial [Gammaproteobacteria bacterium]
MVAIESCLAADFEALVAALDAEFVTKRGRTLSLAQRFPHVLSSDRLENIYVLYANDALVSSVVTRPFTWRADEDPWRGAMIGMVYTAPEARGQGYGSRLLDTVTQRLTANGTEFAVLWSGLHGYYESRAWIRHDTGMFGIVNEKPRPAPPPHVASFTTLA